MIKKPRLPSSSEERKATSKSTKPAMKATIQARPEWPGWRRDDLVLTRSAKARSCSYSFCSISWRIRCSSSESGIVTPSRIPLVAQPQSFHTTIGLTTAAPRRTLERGRSRARVLLRPPLGIAQLLDLEPGGSDEGRGADRGRPVALADRVDGGVDARKWPMSARSSSPAPQAQRASCFARTRLALLERGDSDAEQPDSRTDLDGVQEGRRELHSSEVEATGRWSECDLVIVLKSPYRSFTVTVLPCSWLGAEPAVNRVGHANDLETQPLAIVHVRGEGLFMADGLHRPVGDDRSIVPRPGEVVQLGCARTPNERDEMRGVDGGEIPRWSRSRIA